MCVAAITAQVFERIDLNKSGDKRHDDKHDDGEAVNGLTDRKLNATDLPPIPYPNNRCYELPFRCAVNS